MLRPVVCYCDQTENSVAMWPARYARNNGLVPIWQPGQRIEVTNDELQNIMAITGVFIDFIHTEQEEA